ncbi:MAG: TonB-dependent receptor [Saprospiraceae bacterium]|nr:TonB-dependent receptor [Saprospiraceae bacterium]MBK8632544.1 TonB-dependent receptor [Saprospiraceae bacterium]MBP7642633.1 TonB-dependent receptor [Saprospiraceae bacterium]HMS68905.1 TonB-dependent receptor [Saprospiraceae bacterium]
MEYQLLKTEQKALEINLNTTIYGTFAEIGAGQEVARNFFQAGAAANTIAKTMSAYDKTYSDAIYGSEASGRYVCESRVYKMLDHEWQLLDERLKAVKPTATFFAFSDSVTTINYSKTVNGQGWLGIRFQLVPGEEPNEIVVHTKLLDNDTKLQQEAVGVLGVNLLYAVYYLNHDPKQLVKSLHDGLRGRLNVDHIRLTGPNFNHVDNRLLVFYLVKYGLTELAIFDENHMGVHASEILYKKSLMVVRGHFKPPTLVTLDVFKSGFEQFLLEPNVHEEKSMIMAELTLDYLRSYSTELDEEDFLQRADLLNLLGYKVIVSDCTNHQMMINYMSDHKIQNLGLVIGVRELLDIINEKYYENRDGRLLVAFGELFTRNIKIFAYPALDKEKNNTLTAYNLPVPEGISFLYKHLINAQQIVEIDHYNPDLLKILPQNILEEIKKGSDVWKQGVPDIIYQTIVEKGYFNFKKQEN